MNRRQVFSVIVAAPLVRAQTRPPSIRERVLGAWDLISWEETNAATGEIAYPCGKNAVGQIIYDASGRMSAQIMNPERREVGGQPRVNLSWVKELSGAQALDVLSGYISYFGRFTVDEARHAITHHVNGDIKPGTAAVDKVRFAEFLTKDRIVLKYPNGPNENRLIWERAR